MVQSALREVVKRCFGREENLALCAAWACLLEVVQNSIAGFTNERIFLRSALKNQSVPCLKFRCAKPLEQSSSYVF